MLLINSSFVGGLGAARKTASFIKHINGRIDYRLLTDSASVEKLVLVGLQPDKVITIEEASPPEKIYDAVHSSLSSIEYEAMISFGWRTFVPANAIERNKPVVIVDGGWPECLGDYPSPFWKEIYTSIKSYCLTSHFFHPEMNNLLKQYREIPFKWIFHPFQVDEIRWHTELRDNLIKNRSSLPYYLPGHRSIFLNMNEEYVEPTQGSFTGGWLKPSQLDECRGFVTRLLMELDGAKEPLVLIVSREIARQFEPVISCCRTLKVMPRPPLNIEKHHIWRAGADLVLVRAARSVGAAQVALSNTPALHMICPARDDYMGELSSCKIAERMGIAKFVDHEKMSLRDAILDHLDSKISQELSWQAQIQALSFWQTNGPESLLETVLEENVSPAIRIASGGITI